jgi:methionine aminotransferase
MPDIKTKLPGLGTSIFAVMSGMAREHGAINLSQGFPDFESDPVLIDLVARHMKMGHNQYAPMPGLPALREEIARKATSRYRTNISPEEVTITAGATQAIFNALMGLIKSGDEVIIMEPAYDSYLPGVLLAGGKPVPVPFLAPDFDFPWDAVEEKVTERTKMIMVTNPHNPLGRILKEEDYERMAAITDKHDVLFLFDEVYEHMVYDGKTHLSALNYPDLYSRSVVTYSFGKTFHNTGWKIGYTIAGKDFTKEIQKVHQFNVFSVNTPVQYALADYMAQGPDYDGINTFYQKKRDYLTKALSETPLKPLLCEGSYFMLADYSALSDLKDMAFAEQMTKETGVATIPLSPFYSSDYDGRVVRFCFAKKKDTLDAAIERLVQLK